MTTWHGYFGIENLGLDDAQRGTLVAAVRHLGPATDQQPARLCHWRTRLDGQAAIFEAAFNTDNLTIAKWKERLGALFGVDPITIDHDTGTSGDTPVVTFSRNETPYLRVALFGGLNAGWNESGDECRAYLRAHLPEWEEPLEEGEASRIAVAWKRLRARGRIILKRVRA